MRKGILTLVAGLIAGLLAQVLYYSSFKPCQDETLECHLAWIQDYLSLSSDQYELVVAMHRDHQPIIGQLEQQIRQLEIRLAALEEERIENDHIDFIAFYSYLQEKVDLDKTRDTSTQSFLTQVGEIMNSDQKERFKELINEFKTSPAEGS
jgi:hypothetical protein